MLQKVQISIIYGQLTFVLFRFTFYLLHLAKRKNVLPYVY